MQYLFNSRGEHVANFVDVRLHTPSGKNIGHYLPSEQVFIDMDGRYLGEIILNDRLMYNRSSPYRSKTFSKQGTHSSAGNFGTPGNQSSIGNVSGYSDIPPSRLGG